MFSTFLTSAPRKKQLVVMSDTADLRVGDYMWRWADSVAEHTYSSSSTAFALELIE